MLPPSRLDPTKNPRRLCGTGILQHPVKRVAGRNDGVTPGARWALLAAVAGSAMSFIDGTAVNVAMPVLQRDFAVGAATAQWVIEGYALFLSALLLAGGALGDRLGRRRIFAAGIVIFTLGSLACALAPSILFLIVARCIQGAGGALAVPGSLALISAAYSGEARGKAIGTWSGLSAVTTAAGPVLGGWLVQSASWRWVFAINLPAALVVLYALRHVRESRDESARGKVDFGGAALATLGLGGLVYGLLSLQDRHANASASLALVAGVVLLGAFVWYERRAASPMLPFGLFRSRTFTLANLYTLFLYAALGGSLYFLPFDLIDARGYSPEAAGAVLLPFIAIMFALSRFSGGLVERVGPRAPLVAGALLAGTGFVLLGLAGLGPPAPYWTSYFPGAVVLGFGGACFVAPLTTTVMGSVEVAHTGLASGVNNAVSRLAGLLALAVLGLLFATAFRQTIEREIAAAPRPPQGAVATIRAEEPRLIAGEVPDAVRRSGREAVGWARRAYDRSFFVVMAASGGLCAVAALLALGIRRPQRTSTQDAQ